MSKYQELPLAQITANSHQPRTIFDDDALWQLAASIKENGLLQPITVRKTDKKQYQIIAGERRFRACQLLQMEKIPAIVMEMDDVRSAQLALIENIQREDLSPLLESKAYQDLLNLTGLTQSALAKKLGKSQASVANKLRLLNLSPEVIEALENREISERHGRALLSLPDEKQNKALNQIVQRNLTVKQTEAYVQSLQPKPKKKKMKCYGVSPQLIIRSFKETYQKCRTLTDKVDLKQSEDDEAYIMTITIKK